MKPQTSNTPIENPDAKITGSLLWIALVCVFISGFLFERMFGIPYLSPRLRVSFVNLIQPGMTERDVAIILGGSPGAYEGAISGFRTLSCTLSSGSDYQRETQKTWFNNYYYVDVYFDDSGRVRRYSVEKRSPIFISGPVQDIQ